MEHILLIEQTPKDLSALAQALTDLGYFVRSLHRPADYTRSLAHKKIDLVVMDKGTDAKCSPAFVAHVKTHNPAAIFIVITEFASVVGAVQAMKSGVDEYLPKTTDYRLLLDKITAYRQPLTTPKKKSPANLLNRPISGTSPVFNSLSRHVEKVKNLHSALLLTGETGTGKTTMAKYIHRSSGKKDRPFIHVDCPSLSESLIESELFGFEKGAFTGATDRGKGKFELAENGTIFLDEIGALSLRHQSKLLNVIQERSFYRVGGSQAITMKARIITATNENLEELVQQQRFRADLFYRLNVIRLECPPLRERMEDFEALLQFFIHKHTEELKIPAMDYEESLKEALCAYPWPGNIRELENSVLSMIALADGPLLSIADVPDKIMYPQLSGASPLTDGPEHNLNQLEKQTILTLLERNKGNKTKTAKELGISRRSLYNKLETYAF